MCLRVCYYDNSKLHASILTPQTGFVGNGSDHLQLIKFWPSRTPGKGSVAGQNFWLCLTTVSMQCLHLSEHFFISTVFGYDQSNLSDKGNTSILGCVVHGDFESHVII